MHAAASFLQWNAEKIRMTEEYDEENKKSN